VDHHSPVDHAAMEPAIDKREPAEHTADPAMLLGIVIMEAAGNAGASARWTDRLIHNGVIKVHGRLVTCAQALPDKSKDLSACVYTIMALDGRTYSRRHERKQAALRAG
jgi:hypothetical protein